MEKAVTKMRRTLHVFLLLILALSPQFVSALGWQWVRTADKSVTNSSVMGSAHAWPIATDASGNVYMAMWSGYDSVTLGATTYFNASAQSKVVLVKYDKEGNVIWSRTSTEGNTLPIDIAVDPNGNAFLYGYFTGENVKFGSEEITRTAGMGTNTCYIIKFSPDGDLLWKVNSGTISLGSEKQSYGSIAADNFGNVYTTATYYGSVKIGVITLTNAGGEDVSVAKYSAGGGLVWAKRIGGTGYERASKITVSNENGLYVVGEFSSLSMAMGSSNLNYSASYPSSSYSCFNIFLARLNAADGSIVWGKQSTGDSRVMSVVADEAGNVYLGGSLRSDTVSFSGLTVYGNSGNPFYAKYSSQGDVLRVTPFVQTLASPGSNHAIWDLAVDACNNIWVCGGMDSAFGNGAYLDSFIIMPQPQERIDPMFIAAYTDEGLLADYAALGSGGLSNSGVAADQNGNIYLSGYYNASKALRVGVDSVSAVPNSYKNYFIAKYASYTCTPNSIAGVANASNGINIFPNPASDILTLSAPFVISSVTVTDVMGKPVYHAAGSNASNPVNVRNLAPGIYLVRINSQHIARFVKQ